MSSEVFGRNQHSPHLKREIKRTVTFKSPLFVSADPGRDSLVRVMPKHEHDNAQPYLQRKVVTFNKILLITKGIYYLKR